MSDSNTGLIPQPLDCAKFRLELAGFVDPSALPESTAIRQDVRDAVVRFTTVLAHLFSDDFDRITLWSRIDSAIRTSNAKGTAEDLDHWADLALEHIKADPGRAVACDALAGLRDTWNTRPTFWRQAFYDYACKHSYALIQFARQRWEGVKSKAVEL